MQQTGKWVSAAALVFMGMSVMFTQCTKTETEEVFIRDTVYIDPNDTGIFVPGNAIVDTSFNFDKVHSNVNWQSEVYDFGSTMLTGRFNNFNFTPEFSFNETNLAATSCNFWIQASTYNTSEPGRDGLGKCGLNYLGIVYLDTNKTLVDPVSDSIYFRLNNVVVNPQDGYKMKGTMTFNRYRLPSGFPDGTPITKNVTIYLSYNGMRDFDTNGDGVYDRYRAGFTGTFTFKRSDFMDNASTVPFWPVPKASEAITNGTTAANNKTYGVWSTSTADEVEVTVNALFVKNH